MSKNSNESYLPKNTDPQPGAEVTLRTDANGDVTLSFSDGSENLTMSRRDFMRVSSVAAATVAMSTAACRYPAEEIVPYVSRPEDVRIGHTQQYATTCSACPTKCGILAQTRAGRPFKLEGNPNHPLSQGGSCARGQASYLDLYDPDREQHALNLVGDRRVKIEWETLDAEVRKKLQDIKTSGGVYFLTGSHSGTARKSLFNTIMDNFKDSKHLVYEALNDGAILKASNAAYGSSHIPHYHFDKADLIVSLGSDFLGTWLSPVEFTKQFASRRNPDGNMNRLIAFEANLSLTGANADNRYRTRPTDLAYVALGLAHELINTHNLGTNVNIGAIRAKLAPFTADAVASATGSGITVDILKKTAQELAQNTGKSLIVAGGHASKTANGISLEAGVHLLNAILGNDGHTVDHATPLNTNTGSIDQLKTLIDDINANKVNILFIDGTNPVYNAPPELNIAQALKKVPMVISTALAVDETSAHAHYLATGTHALESWNDSNPFGGLHAIQQPVIAPMYHTRSFEDSLLSWFSTTIQAWHKYLEASPAPVGAHPGGPSAPKDPGAWYRYLRDHWQNTIYAQAKSIASFDEFWRAALRKGSVEVPYSPVPKSFNAGAVANLIPSSLPENTSAAPGDLSTKTLQLYPTVGLYDGQQSNNGHLQELPDPITRHTWGSYVLVSPKTFKEAKLKTGDFLDITLGNTNTSLPFQVMVQPGLHDDVVAIPLGYGRTHAGEVGNEVGENAFQFTGIEGDNHVYAGMQVSLKKTGKNEVMSILKGAGVIDVPRHRILGTTTLDEYKKDPTSGMYTTFLTRSMWGDREYDGVRWAMSIDLTKCTGCSACVVACQEENNIPVVGKNGIIEGREMYWLRIDRYYKLPEEALEDRQLFSDPMYKEEPVVAFSQHLETPRVLMQPMLCQHCSNAPCETVCPVLATMHSAEGLNQMAYNRCVGTRYCSNNCPYKVRRYNWFSYSSDRRDSFFARLYPELKEHGRMNMAQPLTLGLNPDVTVRDRGVMEKCTFCVQRIRRAKWNIMKEGRREFRDGDVVTACQQACPADAIVFGNVLESDSPVQKEHDSPRATFALSDLKTRPAVAYLSSIWNTEEDMA